MLTVTLPCKHNPAKTRVVQVRCLAIRGDHIWITKEDGSEELLVVFDRMLKSYHKPSDSNTYDKAYYPLVCVERPNDVLSIEQLTITRRR